MKCALYISVFLSGLSLILFSCTRDSDLAPADMGYNFYPNEPGDYILYQVDSTRYDDFFDTVITTQFLLKEVYDSWFTDSQGRNCLRIERWVKMSDTTDWFLRDVWYSCMTASRLERLEENVRFTRLVFPVERNSEWNGNAFNMYDEQMYEYDQIDEPAMFGSLMFDSTVTVIQEISSNLIEDKNQIEVYARGVGLIYKKFKDVEKDFVTGDIVAGVDYSFTIIDYEHH